MAQQTQLQKGSLTHAKRLLVLLTEYLLAPFVLGMLVRDYNWYNGRPATHHPALEVLDMSLLVLFRLLAGEEGGNEYLRTLVTARHMWLHWHNTVVPRAEVKNHVRPSCRDLQQSCVSSLPSLHPSGELSICSFWYNPSRRIRRHCYVQHCGVLL